MNGSTKLAARPLSFLSSGGKETVAKSTRVSLGFIVALLLIAGCSNTSTTAPIKVAPEDTLHTEVERGPVKVEIDIAPKQPRLSDEPTLTLTITSDDGVDIKAPPFGEAVGEFIIRDFHEPLARIEDGRQVLKQVYALEPAQAGSMSIDPITVTFVDKRKDGDGREHVIETEAIQMQVETMIASEAPSLADLRPAEAPVDLPSNSTTSIVWLIAGGVLGLAAVVLILSRLISSRETSEPQLTPQQLARRELDELIASKLSETDLKEFFVELTGVVRRYIERGTGIRAPEQTTEEFLREVNGQQLFSDDINSRLAAFLESADLVKFAGYQPDPQSVKQSTQKAKQFIELEASFTILEPQAAEVPA